jgi:hypothetical protein
MAEYARPDPSLVLTAEEAARRIHPNLRSRTMERWRRNGTGPRFVRVGRRVGYTEEAIAEWLARQSRRNTAEE